MVVGVHMFDLPWAGCMRVISHFVGKIQSPLSLILGGVGVAFMLASAFAGGRWFHHLFYRGELWGYRPDINSN